MMNGILRIQTYRPRQSAPVEGVTVVITGSGFTANRMWPSVPRPAPSRWTRTTPRPCPMPCAA